MLIVLSAFCDICPPTTGTLSIINYYSHWKEERTESQRSSEFPKATEVMIELGF